ncbi:hypothetical protein [Nannocystis punicea]|uniref:Uncharacterized protein n=1 Tax=Nannocystis punicea TaxID=2995304 RepID=A0ABY7GY87_9BACT|nr:hypothetical protein [Nannocystis poenicansa]WAS91870.1 hypothetical protein O0S08_37285 [Nannocystis poenicansa]
MEIARFVLLVTGCATCAPPDYHHPPKRRKENMFAAHTEHQDAIIIASCGESVEGAIEAAIREVTDPNGRHRDLHFKTFEVLNVQGMIDSNGAGKTGHVEKYQVVLRVFGAHRGQNGQQVGKK